MKVLLFAAAVLLVLDVVVVVEGGTGADVTSLLEARGHDVGRAAPARTLTARRGLMPDRAERRDEAPPAAFASGARRVPRAAPPVTTAPPDWVRERGARALSRISYPWRDLGFSVEFRSSRSGLRAVTYTRHRRIVVHVQRDDPVSLTAFDLAHELGHAFDVVHGTWPLRERWLELRGIAPSTPWFGCSGCDDRSTGAGDLAEVFALWQVGAVDFSSRLAPRPDRAQLEDLVQLFDPDWTSRDDPTADGPANEDADADGAEDRRERPPGGGDEAGGGDDAEDDGAGDGGSSGDDPSPSRDSGNDDSDDEQDDDGGDEDDRLPCPVLCGYMLRNTATTLPMIRTS